MHVTMCYVSLIILQGQTLVCIIITGWLSEIALLFLISLYWEESLPLGFVFGGLHILSPRGHQVLLKKSLNKQNKSCQNPVLLVACSLFKSF